MFCIFYYQQRQQGKNRPSALREAQVLLRHLTGQELSAEYKPKIEPMLKEKLKQAEAARKSVKKRRDACAKDSSEYQRLHEEYNERAKIANRIDNSRRILEEYCQKELPFASPNYWAAFTCAGLR